MLVVIGKCCTSQKSVGDDVPTTVEEEEEEILRNQPITREYTLRCAKIERDYRHDRADSVPGTILHYLKHEYTSRT